MAKYDRLGSYLTAAGTGEIRLSFGEIENILGFDLPRSAYAYPQWWANGGHTQAHSWMQAGYITAEVDVPDQTVLFRKAGVQSGAPAACSHGNGLSRPAPKERVVQPKVTRGHRSVLTVGGYDFVYIQDLLPECENGHVKEYRPQNHYHNKDRLPLLPDGGGAFCRFSIQAPEVPGVYLWVVEGQIVYIGETVNLKQRFNVGYGNISPRNCYYGGQSTNCRMNKVVLDLHRSGKNVALYFYQTRNYKQVELDLLKRFRTKYNVKDN